MFLLFLESLGTTEILVILVVALVLFGPRRLPQLSRSLGKSLGEFKRASEDFKRTWEREVQMEGVEKEVREFSSMLSDDRSIIGTEARAVAVRDAAAAASDQAGVEAHDPPVGASTEAVTDDASAPPQQLAEADAEAPAPEQTRKRDWL